MAYFTTPPLQIIDKPADARHTSGPRAASEIKIIVLHATVGPFASSLDWLTTNPNSNVSCHRLIDQNGKIYKIADDLTIANHVGFSRMGPTVGLNRQALGIELVNANDGIDPYETAQLASAVAQVIEWKALYGDLPLLTHAAIDLNGKTDPRGFPWRTFNLLYFARLRGLS